MAVRRRPLSKQVISTLRAKAKKRKNITLGQLKKVYRRGQGAFYLLVQDLVLLWLVGVWVE